MQRTLIALTAAIVCTVLHAQESAKPAATRATVAPAKHNGSGIVLNYEAPARAEVNQISTLTLRLSGVAADGASIELRAPAGLTVTPPGGTIALPRGVETTLTLSVTPTAHGVHYVDVFTRQNGRMSAHSIAVSTGTATTQHLKRAGSAQATPSGERIVSLPAQ